jgi:hypothetical protein
MVSFRTAKSIITNTATSKNDMIKNDIAYLAPKETHSVTSMDSLWAAGASAGASCANSDVVATEKNKTSNPARIAN